MCLMDSDDGNILQDPDFGINYIYIHIIYKCIVYWPQICHTCLIYSTFTDAKSLLVIYVNLALGLSTDVTSTTQVPTMGRCFTF